MSQAKAPTPRRTTEMMAASWTATRVAWTSSVLTMNEPVFDEMPSQHEVFMEGVLRVEVSHVLYPVTMEVLQQVFGPFGATKVCLLEESPCVEAMVWFRSHQDAVQAQEDCNGRCIWDGCCVMSISQVQSATFPATPTSLASMAAADTNILLVEDMSDEVLAPVEEMAPRQKAFGALDAVGHDHVTVTPSCVLLRNTAVEDDCMLRFFLGVRGPCVGKASVKHLKYHKQKLICEALGGCLSLQTSTTPQATSMMVSGTAPRIDLNRGIGIAVSANTSKAGESTQRRYISHLNLTDAVQLCYATDNHEAYKLFEGLNNQTQMLSCQPCFLDGNTLLQMGVTACCIFDRGKIKQGDVTVAVTKHWPPPMQMEMLEQTDLVQAVIQPKPPWSSMNNEQSFKLGQEGLHLNYCWLPPFSWPEELSVPVPFRVVQSAIQSACVQIRPSPWPSFCGLQFELTSHGVAPYPLFEFDHDAMVFMPTSLSPQSAWMWLPSMEVKHRWPCNDTIIPADHICPWVVMQLWPPSTTELIVETMLGLLCGWLLIHLGPVEFDFVSDGFHEVPVYGVQLRPLPWPSFYYAVVVHLQNFLLVTLDILSAVQFKAPWPPPRAEGMVNQNIICSVQGLWLVLELVEITSCRISLRFIAWPPFRQMVGPWKFQYLLIAATWPQFSQIVSSLTPSLRDDSMLKLDCSEGLQTFVYDRRKHIHSWSWPLPQKCSIWSALVHLICSSASIRILVLKAASWVPAWPQCMPILQYFCWEIWDGKKHFLELLRSATEMDFGEPNLRSNQISTALLHHVQEFNQRDTHLLGIFTAVQEFKCANNQHSKCSLKIVFIMQGNATVILLITWLLLIAPGGTSWVQVHCQLHMLRNLYHMTPIYSACCHPDELWCAAECNCEEENLAYNIIFELLRRQFISAWSIYLQSGIIPLLFWQLKVCRFDDIWYSNMELLLLSEFSYHFQTKEIGKIRNSKIPKFEVVGNYGLRASRISSWTGPPASLAQWVKR